MQALPQRELRGQITQLRDEVLVPAAAHLGLDVVLDGLHPHLFQARNLTCPQQIRRDVDQRCPAPQRQRLVEQRGGARPGAVGGRRARQGAQLLEVRDVEFRRVQVELVAARAGPDPPAHRRAERPAQAAEVDAHGAAGVGSRRAVPDDLHEFVERYLLVRPGQQRGEQSPEPAVRHRGLGPGVVRDEQRSQQSQTHRSPMAFRGLWPERARAWCRRIVAELSPTDRILIT
ncbi:MAG: hypothetical protein AUG49_15035 [Catenulispora sp. 13_1_20CM_3_70_7]|nr:MAG: hypothetical protein AUG49_15035 [Catenulispora sp. 13_1_20CM_3_70_7]